jgi:DNA polymerase III alpha subunit
MAPLCRQAVERTMGVPIFQEQVIQLAVVAAVFIPGEADQLRRAMAGGARTRSVLTSIASNCVSGCESARLSG